MTLKKFLSVLFAICLLSSPCFAGINLNGDADYVNITDDDSLSDANNITLGAYINPSVLDEADTHHIIGKDNNGTNTREYGLILRNVSGNYRLTMSIFKAGNGETLVSDDDFNFAIDTEYCVVGTYEYVGDGSSIIKLYIDGALAHSVSNAKGPIQNTATDVRIGARQYSGYTDYFKGTIREAFVSLSTYELIDVESYCNSKVKRMPLQLSTSGFYLPLDDFADGTSLNTDANGYKDLSSNGNHGQGVDGDGDSSNVAETVLTY